MNKKNLTTIINEYIEQRMQEFSTIARTSKSVDHEDRSDYYQQLYAILEDLELVYDIIAERYPEYIPLFNALKLQYKGRYE